MTRRKDTRRPRPELKLLLEPLETRWLLNGDARRPRPDRAAAPLARALESLLATRSDADAFARGLARHPRLADDLGLGGLALALRQHAGYAARRGWGATLTHELDTHPRYAAAHHLTSFAARDPVERPTRSATPPPAASTAATSSVGRASVPAASPPVAPPSAPATTPPADPPIVVQDPQTIAVGGTLDVALPNLGLGDSGVTYTITPQPLPANMTFNRGTGELIFAPAPGQAGTLNFSVAVSGASGTGTIILPVTVTSPAVPSTEVSGQVVDENGNPLAGMPVSIGTATAVTDQQGDFTLAGIPANPGPISAGGSLAEAEDRLALTAPVPQLLGHAIYLGARNVIPTPLIVPSVNWSAPVSFSQSSAAQPLDITNPAMTGFDIHLPASAAAGALAVSGSLSVAELPASLAAQHLPPGVSGGLLLYQVVGSALPSLVQLTLPNSGGYAPGAVLALLGFNPLTGGHDVIGHMVVSADGQTMTSSGLVALNPATTASSSPSAAGESDASIVNAQSDPETEGCIGVAPTQPNATPTGLCAGCQPTANGTVSPSNQSPTTQSQDRGALGVSSTGKTMFGGGSGGYSGSGSSGSGGYSGSGSSGSGGYSGSGSSGSGSGGYSGPRYGGGSGLPVMDSDAGLVTGEYFLDHQLVPYQSQGQSIGVDLQYSSGQADPTPVVQYQFTTPYAGDSSDISSITAQVSLAGVSQGDPVTYDTPDGLTDGETYNIPLQVDASALPTGVYPYTMTVTENFGTEVITAITTTNDGYVNVVNDSSSPYGAGWSIGGLQQLEQVSTGGPVLITAGQQGTEQFDPVYSSGQANVEDLGLATTTSWAQVLANDGAGGFSATESTSASAVGTATGVFTSDGLPDLAVVSSYTLAILLDNGSGGFTAGDSYSIPSGYEAKAVAVGNFSGHTNGTLDIAVLLASTTTDAYSVAEYTGNGSGGFATPVISAAGNGVSSGTVPDSMIAFGYADGGDKDLAFTTDNGLADVMAPTSGGSFGSATSLSMPSGHNADGVTAVDYNDDGDTDLVVEAANTDDSDGAGPFASLDLFEGNGSGGFTDTATYQTVGHPDTSVIGLVAGDFQGSSAGLEVAVPVVGDSVAFYLAVVPLSTSGTWGGDALYTVGDSSSLYPGDIIAADLNGAGKPSIALTDGGDQIHLFLADPASNQFLPEETVTANTSSTDIGLLAAAPFMGVAATPGYRGPTSDPSTLVQNEDGTWTRTYPDGTVIQFNSSGQETSETDVNGNTFSYAYVTSGAAAGALATITDPVGLVTTLTYDESGYLSTVTDPASRVTTFTVDSSDDDLTEIEDPDGAETQYAYDANHEASSETNADGKTATPHYNSFGQLTSETLFDGTSTTSIDPAQSNGLLAPGHSGSLPTTYQASVTDPDGHTTTLVFNGMSHPTEEIDADGGITTMTYDSHGFVASVTDPMNRTVTYTNDSAGDVTSISEYELQPGDLLGTTITETIAYDDLYGVPTSITDFNGNTTTFTLDSHGNVLEEMQPGGVDQEWTYNSAGQPLTYTDADGNVTTYTYNSVGNLATITEPLPGSPTIQYGYDSAGDVTSVTDAVGDTTTMTYDLAGRVLTEENPVQAAAGKDTAFTYDDEGNLLTVTDADGHTTTYSYNARNELVSVTDPMDRVTTYGYDAAGNLITVTDPMDNVTTYTYDDDNNELSAEDPLGGITSYVYDQDGEITSMTDPNGFTTTYLYDSLGQLAGESQPVKVGFFTEEEPVGTFTYDNDGNLVKATDGLSHTTTYVYNALNEETSVTNADGDTTSYTYDGDGDVLTVTDGLGHATTMTYDALGDVLTETQPTGGGTTTMTYDGAGDLLTVTDPDSNVTTYTYTAAHQVATETTPTDGVYTYTYDPVGNLVQSVDPDNHTVTYSYDADNEVTGVTWENPEGGTPLDVFAYSYNADGELTAVSDDSSSYAYGYNADGEVTSVSDAGTTGLASVTLDYTYDADGNRTSMSDSLGGVVSYTYDARDELTNETLSGTGVSAEAVKFTYDNAGNMTGQTRYSNLAESTVVAATSYTYDSANEMTGIVDKNSGGTTLVSYGYTYDDAGRVTQEVRVWDSGTDTATLTYDYTNNNQLTSVTSSNTSLLPDESFSWDANGNQTGTGFTTSTGNEQTASPGYTYTYDADGNMITSTDTSTGDEWTYSYNFAGQMTGAVETNSLDAVLAQATYTYDALGNRIGIDDNNTQTWTLFDGGTPVMDFNGSGSLEMRYLNGPAGDVVDTVLARESSGGTIAWYLPDRLGTIRDLISNSGSIIDHVDYSAFGTQLDESYPSEGDRMMGFAGMERDTVTGLNLAVRRIEDPATRRWTSQDPIGFAAKDSNLYRYVRNDPADLRDESGLLVAAPVAGAVVVAGPVAVVGIGVGVGLGVGGAELTSPITRPYFWDPIWNWVYGNGPYSAPLPRPMVHPDPLPLPFEPDPHPPYEPEKGPKECADAAWEYEQQLADMYGIDEDDPYYDELVRQPAMDLYEECMRKWKEKHPNDPFDDPTLGPGLRPIAPLLH